MCNEFLFTIYLTKRIIKIKLNLFKNLTRIKQNLKKDLI